MFGKVIQAIIISLTSVFLPAVGAGVVGVFIKVGFWIPFIVMAIVMFIIGYLSNVILTDRHSRRMYALGESQTKAIADQKMWVPCAYCKKLISVFTSTSHGDIVDCPECKKANRLSIEIGTIQITEPIDSDPLTMDDLVAHGLDVTNEQTFEKSITI